MHVDWAALRQQATAAMAQAYAPYSNYRVGAAAIVNDGTTITGCNVENASYGLALCAECGLVSQLILNGGGRLKAFTCVNGSGNVIMPCGRCRQLLWEHGGADLLVETPKGIVALGDLLPQAFGPNDLN